MNSKEKIIGLFESLCNGIDYLFNPNIPKTVNRIKEVEKIVRKNYKDLNSFLTKKQIIEVLNKIYENN